MQYLLVLSVDSVLGAVLSTYSFSHHNCYLSLVNVVTNIPQCWTYSEVLIKIQNASLKVSS